MFREWSPLEYLLSRIPPIGKFGKDQNITSIASTPYFIALGTNCGSVFWYNRSDDSLQRLDCWSTASISRLDLVETVDLMLGVGSDHGDLIIFQIPKPVQANDGVSFPGTAQNVQQFSIQNVHDSKITSLKWSTNGEKLFSGDKNGCIVSSSIDFFLNSVSSRAISNEDSEIVALDYQMKTLLVSTITSCHAFCINSSSRNSRIKIGRNPRIPGVYGSSFIQTNIGRKGLKMVIVRPNDRVWMTDLDGTVEKTVIFQQALGKSHPQIPLMNPSSSANDNEHTCMEYVRMLSDSDQTMLLWNSKTLHIVSLVNGRVIASCNYFRNILDISQASEAEFFVLETGRSVIRISTKEDILNLDWRRCSTASQGADTAIESTLETFGSKITQTLPKLGLLKAFSFPSNVRFDSFKSKIAKVSASFDHRSPSPEVVDALLGVDYNRPGDRLDEVSRTRMLLENEKYIDKDFINRMDKIGESDYDSNISTLKKSPKLPKHEEKQNQGNPPNSEVSVNYTDDSEKWKVNSELDQLSSLEKEETLLKMLNLDTVKDSPGDKPNCDGENESKKSKVEEATAIKSEIDQDIRNVSMDSTANKDSSIGSSSTNIGYGPPSDNSALTVSLLSSDKENRLEDVSEEQSQCSVTLEAVSGHDQEMICHPECLGDGWKSYELPGQSGTWCQNEQFVCFCDNRENVYYSPSVAVDGGSLVWRRTNFQASAVSTSSSGQIVWRLHRHTAYCLVNHDLAQPLTKGSWHKLCENVASVWVGSSSAWIVKLDGGLVHHPNISSTTPYSLHPRQIYTGHFLSEVREVNGYILGKTVPNSELAMCALDQLSSEVGWMTISTPGHAVCVYNLGPNCDLWISDSQGHVNVSKDWFKATRNKTPVTWFSIHVQMITDSSLPGGILPPALCKPILHPGMISIWVASTMSSLVMAQSYPVDGYNWSKLPMSSQLTHMRIKSVYGGGRDAYAGHLILNIYGGPLLQANLSAGTLTPIAIPGQENVHQVSVVPGYIWLLTLTGNIYIKPGKEDWSLLPLDQFHGNVRLISVSIATSGQVWAVADSGQVFMTLTTLDPPPAHATPAWIPVDMEGVNTGGGERIVEVVCSSNGYMVWVRDNSHGVYVREGVFPDDHPIGTGWVHVTGLSVASLAVSRTSVWALSTSGQIFRRHGVTSSDWVGDRWHGVLAPGGQATAVTVGQCDTVWAVDRAGHLQQLSVTEIGVTGLGDGTGGAENDDWTLIQ